MSTFALVTLGCKVNSYESQWYREQLVQKGLEEVSYKEKADVYIINTCAVTNVASAKSRQKIHACRKLNSDAIVCAVGCYVQTSQNQDVWDDIDLVIATSGKKQLPELVLDALATHMHKVVYEDTREYTMDSMPLKSYQQTRAYLKIQDGCNQFCSYCIIPYARGKERCLPIDEVVENAKSLVQDGHKELVLTGIHTGRYQDLGYNLTDLMKRLMKEVEGLQRLRISSIEITEITDEMIAFMHEEPRIARHFHIPVQASTNEILEKMNRPYTVEEFIARLQYIREQLPNISISTDIIVGFPYESDELFEQGLENLEKMEFSFLHVFPFSSKEGTVAHTMKEKVNGQIQKNRVKYLTKRSVQLYNTYKQRLVGTVKEVYFETYQDGILMGHTSEYVSVKVKSEIDRRNEIVSVMCTHLLDGELWGNVIEG